MAAGIAKGGFFIFTDSDCQISPDAVENAVKIFQNDKTIGAIAGHIRERDVKNGNALRKIMDVRLDNSCRIIKGMESSFSSVTCCSGPLSAYRREAIEPFIHQWANDRFLGNDFRFSTDRRLTAFVLNAKPPLHNSGLFWKLKYSQSMMVYCREPDTFRALIKQRIRWQKSFIRSIFATGANYWKRPFFGALTYYLQISLRIIRPYIVLKALFLLPLVGDYSTAIFYVSGVLFSAMIYGIDFKLRNPTSGLQWLYRPLMQLITIYILNWLIFYAAANN